jgi:hypothetical protein
VEHGGGDRQKEIFADLKCVLMMLVAAAPRERLKASCTYYIIILAGYPDARDGRIKPRRVESSFRRQIPTDKV